MNKYLFILCLSITLSGLITTNIVEVSSMQKITSLPTPTVIITNIVEPTKPSYIRDIPLAPELQEYTWNKCNESNLVYEQVLALLGLESGYNTKLIHTNNDGSKDYGLAQINNSPENMKWFTELSGHKDFDPMNPYHAIDACVGGLFFYKKYWANRGVDDIRYTLNSYNMGLGGYKHYLRTREVVSRGYDREITKRKEKLTKEVN